MSYHYNPNTRELIYLDEEQATIAVLPTLGLNEVEEELPEEAPPPRSEVLARRGRPRKAGRKPTACGNCGKVGHTRRTCGDQATRGLDVAKLDQDQQAWNEYKAPISSTNFEFCKESQKNEQSAVETAAELDLEIQDVNYAYRSRSYDDYVGLARREHFKR